MGISVKNACGMGSSMYADIIVDISHEQLDRTFQYAVPEEMEQDIDVGVLVNVPFGRGNRTITGYVIELSNEPKLDIDKIKYIKFSLLL